MSANANVIDINAQSHESTLAPIGERAGHLGVEIADIAGLIEDLAGVGAQQDRQIHEVMAAARDMNETTSNLDQAMEETARAAQQSRGILELSAQKITNVVDGSITTMTALGEGALDVRDTLGSVQETAGAVQKASTAIGQIARETKLLALNASVEAARAGDAGAGFAIIASAVKSLADQIGNFSGQIEGELKSMAGAIDTLTRQTETNATTAQKARAESEAAREASADLAELVVSVDRLVADIEAMRAPIARNTEGFLSVKTGLDALSQASDVSQLHLDSARDRAHSILKISEDFILFIAESGVETSDTPLIALAKQTADMVAETFTEAVARGEITMDALFDTRYRDIPGTDPKQVLARFTALTDKYLPAIQEPVLKFDPRIMFCAAVDLNGYLPTHNAIYSRPQGTDPVWNAANCRNRRIFNDRTGLSAGQSTKPFLLQTYRRDMGGGNFVLMKDCSAPIMVNGRHWGGLRIAYKVD